jgi:hypothetical protein
MLESLATYLIALQLIHNQLVSIMKKCKISLENNDIGCDESNIIIENETLVGRVNALTHDLEKAYGGKAKLDFILGSQRCFLNREGLRYLPKKGNNAL